MMKVAILGAGVYGQSLASACSSNKCQVSLWTKFKTEINQLEQKFNQSDNTAVSITNDLSSAILAADLIIIAVPAQAVESLAKLIQECHQTNKNIVITSKGFSGVELLFKHQIWAEHNPTHLIGILSGPTFASDIKQEQLVGLTLATNSQVLRDITRQVFLPEKILLEETTDMIGVELCGAIKNVIAVGAGIINGMGLHKSTQALFLTQAIQELANILPKLGADQKTILKLAGIGDLIMTATAPQSRNFQFGVLIGRKASVNIITTELETKTIESYKTLAIVKDFLDNSQVSANLITQIYDIVYKQAPPEELLIMLEKGLK